MTEKRYLYYEEPNGEFPFPYIKRDDGKEIISLYECSELLNGLVEENEQLKSTNMEMEDYLGRLEEKNEELKKRLVDRIKYTHLLETELKKRR